MLREILDIIAVIAGVSGTSYTAIHQPNLMILPLVVAIFGMIDGGAKLISDRLRQAIREGLKEGLQDLNVTMKDIRTDIRKMRCELLATAELTTESLGGKLKMEDVAKRAKDIQDFIERF